MKRSKVWGLCCGTHSRERPGPLCPEATRARIAAAHVPACPAKSARCQARRARRASARPKPHSKRPCMPLSRTRSRSLVGPPFPRSPPALKALTAAGCPSRGALLCTAPPPRHSIPKPPFLRSLVRVGWQPWLPWVRSALCKPAVLRHLSRAGAPPCVLPHFATCALPTNKM